MRTPVDGMWISPQGQAYTGMGWIQADGSAIVCVPLPAPDGQANPLVTYNVPVLDPEIFTEDAAVEWGPGVYVVRRKIGIAPAFFRAGIILSHDDANHRGTYMLRGTPQASPPWSDHEIVDVVDSDQSMPGGPPPFDIAVAGLFISVAGA